MRKIILFCISVVIILIMITLNFSKTEIFTSSFTKNEYCLGDNCNDKIEDCKKPRSFNSENDGCACFDCEKGTPNHRLICTNNEDDKKKLLKLILEDKKNPN